ncbi:MAG: hypothetical protein IT285_00685, partial [Bdellovibrionales bacterium]|nr:hypothetical protein [Bdellovibrionales bacterium]
MGEITSTAQAGAGKRSEAIADQLRIGHLRMEKCELREAEEAFLKAFELARTAGEPAAMVESLAGLLRFAGEALDEARVKRWETELDRVMSAWPERVPPMAWYAKGAIAASREQWRTAGRYYLECVRRARKGLLAGSEGAERDLARAFTMLANVCLQRGRMARARAFLGVVLKRFESKALRGVNGSVYVQLGLLEERARNLGPALQWYRKAHASYLQEHNWYHHLYVLYGYARLARLQQNYSQSYWYLDLMDKAATGPEFGILRREIRRERERLENDAVDLVIDGRNAVVKTRERGSIALGKQYVLLDILQALSRAHGRDGEDAERGLTKAEIIE